MSQFLILKPTLKFSLFFLAMTLTVGCQFNQDDKHQEISPSSAGKDKIFSGQGLDFSSVLNILQSRCTRCHNSGANDWSKEDNIRRVVMSGALVTRLQSRSMPMPQPGSPEASAITENERQTLVNYANGLLSSSTGTQKPDGPEVLRDPFFAALNRCTSCHGLLGQSIAANIPNLAGHDKTYFMSRVQEFLLPRSEGSPMKPVLEQLAKDFNLKYELQNPETVVLSPTMNNFIEKIAMYFANQFVTPEAVVFETQVQSMSAEQKVIYEKGHKIINDNSCLACHMATPQKPGEGFPMVLGQKAEYLKSRLLQFKQGQGGQMMPAIVEGAQLSEQDLDAVVLYLSNTHPSSVVQ